MCLVDEGKIRTDRQTGRRMDSDFLCTGLTLSDLESLPVGVALPLLDCVQRCREAPPSDWSIAAYNMIGRQDISMTIDSNVKLASPTLEFSDDDDGMNLDLEVRQVDSHMTAM